MLHSDLNSVLVISPYHFTFNEMQNNFIYVSLRFHVCAIY
jgi:hypothetical protein